MDKHEMVYEMATDFIVSLIIHTDCCEDNKEGIQDYLDNLVDGVTKKLND